MKVSDDYPAAKRILAAHHSVDDVQSACASALRQNSVQHPDSVWDGLKVADAVQPHPLQAADLDDPGTGAGNPDIDEGLDLEPITPQHAVRHIPAAARSIGGNSRTERRCALKALYP